LWRRFRAAGGLRASLLAGVFAAGVVLMDCWPADPFPYRPGQYVSQDIRARAGFSVVSRKQLEEAQARARSITPASFRPDEALFKGVESELKALPGRLTPYTQPATVPETIAKPFAVASEDALAAWRALARGPEANEYAKALEGVLAQLRDVPLVRQKEKEEQAARGAPQVRLGAKLRSTYDLIGLNETPRTQAEVRRVALGLDAPLRPGVEAYLMGVLATRQQPLYVYDANGTQKDITDALEAIKAKPPMDAYQAGDVLVQRRTTVRYQLLDEDDLNLLREEHRQFQASERQRHPVRPYLRIAGRESILLLIIGLAGAYVWRFRPEAAGVAPRVPSSWGAPTWGSSVWLVAFLLSLLALAKALTQVYELNPANVALPVIVGALVLTIAYDQRFALAMGGILTVVTVFLLRGDLPMLLALASGLAIAVALLREVRTRTKVILVSAAAGCVVLLASWARDVSLGVPWWPVAAGAGLWGAGSALLAGFFVQGMLPLVERVFGVASSMTLLEWCDADKPLLRRLREEAPGTHSHCLQLGAVCEAAADEIGAWGLLARAGAYYHDIGKINKPEYFIENQAGGASRHARLSPAMSLLIITGHVRDGLELAREYGLPPALREFVATHHGTTLAQYFFQAETDRRKEQEDRAPEEADFRYPGPKPRSKEAAILMLADAVESSIRAMPEPTPGRIENQIHAMITRRLSDGQLDDCELTLREVGRIEESFVMSLTAMYHSRMPYPTPAGEEPSAAETKPAPQKE
jgi:putative nucleotidyltransferase with HDIG domain